MNSLQLQLQQIVSDFVAGVLKAIRKMPLAEMSEKDDSAVVPRRTRSTPTRNGRGVPARVTRIQREPEPAASEQDRRRHRASAEEVKRYKNLAMNTAKQMPPGFSKGELMKRAGAKVDLGRSLGLLVEEGLLVRKGERRNARYWLR